jgi:citrate lyase subunit beta/citryl-CoA lyase
VLHPRDVLLGAGRGSGGLPVCDHYSGVEARMRKSLQLQAELTREYGRCVVDVTLDCEDGAVAGAEIDQANMVAALASQSSGAIKNVANVDSQGPWVRPRIGARLHPVDHFAFASDVEIIVGRAGHALSYVMVPKVECLADVERAVAAVDAAGTSGNSVQQPLPIHVLVESPQAVHRVFDIAAHPRVESVSFGLMDFVSAHAGAIPAAAMGVRSASDTFTLDQFHHPLVVRAKLAIASACHAFGKVPSHCVVTGFRDTAVLERAAKMAAQAFGYTRMWSIHPDQIRPIVQAFAPSEHEIESAATIIVAAAQQEWAPIAVAGALHDRASYRYFWNVLERAYRTGSRLPDAVLGFFEAPRH